MTTPLSSRRSTRREQLLQGLIDLFLAEGFARFSMEELAARLQCSKSTLYVLAASKEQLITVVIRAYFRRSAQHVEDALAAESDPTIRIGVYLDGIASELAPASAAFYEDLDAFLPSREIYVANVAVAARRVQELVRDAERPGHPVDATFVGAVAAQVMISIQQGDMRSLTGLYDAAAYRALADLIVAGLAGAQRQPTKTSSSNH